MDTNETMNFGPEPEQTEEPVCREQPDREQSEYHGLGTGQRETTVQAQPQMPEPEPEPEPEPQAMPEEPKKQRKPRRVWRRVAAAVAAVGVIAGACGATAWAVNEAWEERFEALEDRFEEQVEDLERQIDKWSNKVSAGTSVSNTSGNSPSEVYAQNVHAVVAISNYATVSAGWGKSYESVISTGSGFVITADGYVMTNYHVVEGCERLTVTLYTGEELDASLIGYDELNDVAVLKVDAQNMDHVQIGSSDELVVGDMVVAIGNPLGELTSTMTVGYVSGKDRSVSTDGSVINMLQTDAAINSGNSGGPLFNMNGEVIGITTAKYSGSTGSGATIEGIGFAIPIDDVMSMVEDLMEYGYVKNQAYLGVKVISMDASTASMYGMHTGSYVQSVEEGSCAQTAGIQVGDIIIAVGEYEVDSNVTLQTTLRRFSAGDSTTVTVYRAGQEVMLDITFDERPQNVDDGSTQESQAGEMPENGSYEEWYDYFFGPNG